jgi:peptide-methionine (R)-S-oxide reductase
MKMLIQFLYFVLIFTQCNTSSSEKIYSLPSDGKNTDDYAENDPGIYLLNDHDSIPKVIKSDNEWKKQLSSQEYYVLRQKGTERAFTGSLLKIRDEGVYTCKGCGLPLFSSKHKFDSGTGWPSFYDVFRESHIHKDTDYDIGYARTELTCAACGGHLGHVFDDGPKPTGLRYCINSVSLDFVKFEEKNK